MSSSDLDDVLESLSFGGNGGDEGFQGRDQLTSDLKNGSDVHGSRKPRVIQSRVGLIVRSCLASPGICSGKEVVD